MKNKSMMQILLILMFILFSEHVSITVLIVASIIAYLVLKQNQNSYSFELLKIKTVIPWLKFISVLICEIIIANFQVAVIALSPKMAIEPSVVNYRSELRDEFLLTVLANSITLTPGTMTVDIFGSDLKIHCLNDTYKKSLADNKLERMLLVIEGEANG